MNATATMVAALALAAGLTPNPDAFFQQRVEPILVRRCLECHGSDQQGGLDLRRKDSALKGGDSGAALVPGKPEESLLYQHAAEGVMPPENGPLSQAEIAVLRKWIHDGAYFPDSTLNPYAFSTEHRAGLGWWSLQPISKPEPPAVAGDDQPRTIVDRFLLAKLQEKGLEFSAPASRRTLIHRLMHDLHGLKPTYEQVQRFVEDPRPDAYERLVDELLASPRYGERWGRHWLDVVRYAESNGFERDRIRNHFWWYRDYVIESFNEDKPYDLFVKEQLAGDALRPVDPLARIATGFLVAGPKNDVTTISELEQLTTRQDELDDFVSATMTTFTGLTVGCARCHDHKFDPIPTRDYYRLTAVFSGLDRADNVAAAPEEIAAHQRLREAAETKVAQAKSALSALLDPVRDRLTAELERKHSPGDGPPMLNYRRNVDLFEPIEARFVRLVITATDTGNQPCVDELEIYGDGPENLALAASGAKATASSLLPGYPIHQVHHLNDGKTGNDHSWISNEPGVGTAQIELPTTTVVRKVVWGRDRQGKYQDRLAVAYAVQVSVNGEDWTVVADSKRRPPFNRGAQQPLVSDEQVYESLTDAERERFNELIEKISTAEAEVKSLPALPAAYSAKQAELNPAFVLSRGNVRDRRERVGPGALSAVRSLNADLGSETLSGPERRLRLAEWIVARKNPLTARVLVNRIWHYHFGQGIVTTPSDFGLKGDAPSHPELLDWLAADFMEHGWRIKRLHRLIILSAAYRQGSAFREDAADKDAANRLLWRFSPKRLEAETLRDGLLQVCGTLNLMQGGPSFRLFEYRDGNVPDYILIENPGPDTWRRAVYGFNIRTFSHPLMSAFDCPDPSVQTPSRQSSTTALQSLTLMNNPFIFTQCEHFARRVEREAVKSGVDPVVAAYRLALSRDPTPAELELSTRFVAEHGLFSLCRVLINTNEFLYVY